MKKFFLLAIAMLTVLSVTQAQYKYDASFPNNTKADSVLIGQGNGLHGVAVGLDGNVWTVNYNYYVPGDSLKEQGTGVTKAVLPVRVFKADGTPASFSPLMILKGGAVADTLFKGGILGGAQGGTGRGLTSTVDGNILFVWFDNVYLLDYRTGAVLLKTVLKATNGSTAAASDVAGNFYTASVFPGQEPLQMFNKSGVKQGNVTDTTGGYSRSIIVSRAGDKVYYAGYTMHCIVRYTGDPLLGFTADTVLKGFDCESITRSGKTDMLWASSGSGNDKPNQNPGKITYFSSHAWYLWDPATNAIKDSIKWVGTNNFTNADSLGLRPRGVATTTNGDTVYVIMFGSKAGVYTIQRFVKGSTSVNRNNEAVASTFTLGQNYPNPFNPTTNIKFSLPQASNISLKVYDVLGKEVATLAEGRFEAGSFTATFDAKQMNSGVYFYTLRTSTGFVQSSKMLLMK
jgi:Secretion system C-terminal sorting domain